MKNTKFKPSQDNYNVEMSLLKVWNISVYYKLKLIGLPLVRFRQLKYQNICMALATQSKFCTSYFKNLQILLVNCSVQYFRITSIMCFRLPEQVHAIQKLFSFRINVTHEPDIECGHSYAHTLPSTSDYKIGYHVRLSHPLQWEAEMISKHSIREMLFHDVIRDIHLFS